VSELSPNDLVDNDGAVDLRKLNSGSPTMVDDETCATWRDQYRAGALTTSLADEHDVTAECVRLHVRGDCTHDHDTTPVEEPL